MVTIRTRSGKRPGRITCSRGRRDRATLDAVMPPATALRPSVPARQLGLRDRWRERRRLIEQDRRAAQQAELYLLRSLLADASGLVDEGWVQRCWFTVSDERG